MSALAELELLASNYRPFRLWVAKPDSAAIAS